MSILTAFSPRARLVNPDGTPTVEALKLFEIMRERLGGTLGDVGTDVFAPFLPEQPPGPDIVQPLPGEPVLPDLLQQPAPNDTHVDLVQQLPDYSAGTALVLSNYRFSLKDTSVSPGAYGDATHVAKVTVDQQGRITAVENVPITGPGGANYSGSFTGKTVTVVNGIITSVV